MKISKLTKASKAIKFEAKDEKKVIGRAYLYVIRNNLHKQPYGLLEDLFVEEGYRSKGIGKQLLKMVIAEAKKKKLYKLIGTSRTFRTQVHSFYLKSGFKKYGFEFRMNLDK
ncbi:MAG: GNAT family N-acetyltransferase [Candidatus Doudnabacteria bacterium CG10_big_fil_rev_8_21_14_0_10_42_18]|uniref:GNAT family N-acetyltransferase n=1 Tax=Candidatus Doudnabacteria bacterium CG10_big_fil_rev_8_21_14_0_10_42_18 TaxID=1974552 RepID=A0A2H0VAG7_9BACT|nr:MAG: GNAT family N-acetyltransferase [Candidatus Doudnabacteria bacterium CG10_big_fil_rev_8_21_14_0_10_42_18]